MSAHRERMDRLARRVGLALVLASGGAIAVSAATASPVPFFALAVPLSVAGLLAVASTFAFGPYDRAALKSALLGEVPIALWTAFWFAVVIGSSRGAGAIGWTVYDQPPISLLDAVSFVAALQSWFGVYLAVLLLGITVAVTVARLARSLSGRGRPAAPEDVQEWRRTGPARILGAVVRLFLTPPDAEVKLEEWYAELASIDSEMARMAHLADILSEMPRLARASREGRPRGPT